VISIRSLRFAWPSAGFATASPPLFEDFDLEIGRGETWAVLGASGCGKTSLLTLLAGLARPEGGEILIDGERLVRPRPRTGLILQDYGLLPWATVRENAALGLRVRGFYGPDGIHAPREGAAATQRPGRGPDGVHAPREGAVPDKADPAEVGPWLERLAIADIADKYPLTISGGQRQRTAIARTLALGPDLLLMDEPFSSLDALIREDLQDLTLELCREGGLTLVLVTHSIEEAARVGSRILVLGRAPNRTPRVIENPGPAGPGSPEHSQLCASLREALEATPGGGR